MNTETGIAIAVRLAGNQTALALRLGVTPQAVQKWVAQGYVPGDRCRAVSEAVNGGVSPFRLNPAVFGADPGQHLVLPVNQCGDGRRVRLDRRTGEDRRKEAA